jgi:nucleotide-binding universal stress UspA family protein
MSVSTIQTDGVPPLDRDALRRPGAAVEADPASTPEVRCRCRRVLACLDGSELGQRVIPHALALARAFDAPITLLRVLECPAASAGLSDPMEWEIRRSEARERLDHILHARRAAYESIDTEVVEGHAAEQICHWAQHHDADVTVLASHGAGGPTRWSLASTARKLVERLPGSFMLIPAAAMPVADDVARYRRILVPMDGSLRAESVLPVAIRLATAGQAEVILGHVVPVPELTEIGPLDSEAVELREKLVERNERVASAYLDRLRVRLTASGAPIRTMVLRAGDVRSRLARLIVDEDVDLVVLSAHGRSGRVDVPFGSSVEYLLAHASTPLLILRESSPRVPTRPSEAIPCDGTRLPSQATP